MIVSSLVAAALILNVSVSGGEVENDTPFGPSYVKGIDIGVAKLTPTADMLLFEPSKTAIQNFKNIKIGDGIQDMTIGEVLNCIDCSFTKTDVAKFGYSDATRDGSDFASYATCQELFEKAIEKLDIRIAQPNAKGISLLDYVVEKYIAHVDRKPTPETEDYRNKTGHFEALLDKLVNLTFQHSLYKHATIVWTGGHTSVQKLIKSKQYAAAAQLLNLGFFIPQGASLFIELVELDKDALGKEFAKLYTTLSTDNLVMLASWPKLASKLDDIVGVINSRPLTMTNQRESSLNNAENMYRIGQYYEYLRKSSQENPTFNFYDDFNNEQAKLTELQPFRNDNLNSEYFKAIHSYIGTSNTKISDFNLQWQKIVEFKGFGSEFSKSTFAYFKNLNIHLNSVFTAFTVKSAGNYSYNVNEEPIITYLADNGMFTAIAPLLLNVEWKNLHNTDKQSLLLLAANKYISPEFVSHMATKGMLTAKLIQNEMLANPMLNVAHVSDEAKKTLLKEAGAEGLISILQGRTQSSPDQTSVSQTISTALAKSTQLKSFMAKYKLPVWIETEIIALNAIAAEDLSNEKVNELITGYLKQEGTNFVLLCQVFTNASVPIPAFLDAIQNSPDIPLGMFYAYFISAGKDANASLEQAEKSDIAKAFTVDAETVATVVSLANKTSVALKVLPDFGSPQSTSTLTYVFYVLILVVCIVVAVVGARILMTEDSDRRSSSASSVESRDIEAGPAAAEPEAKPATQDDAGRLEEASSSTEPTPEKSQV